MDPSPILVQPDADWCGSVRNVLPRCLVTATGFFLSPVVSGLLSVQSGAIRGAGEASTTAPFSAPLGTTGGASGAPETGPSVPVALASGLAAGYRPHPDAGDRFLVAFHRAAEEVDLLRDLGSRGDANFGGQIAHFVAHALENDLAPPVKVVGQFGPVALRVNQGAEFDQVGNRVVIDGVGFAAEPQGFERDHAAAGEQFEDLRGNSLVGRLDLLPRRLQNVAVGVEGGGSLVRSQIVSTTPLSFAANARPFSAAMIVAFAI